MAATDDSNLYVWSTADLNLAATVRCRNGVFDVCRRNGRFFCSCGDGDGGCSHVARVLEHLADRVAL